MSAIEKMQGGIAINPELMLSGKSLMEEASRLPEERFEAGPGLTVIRQGNFFKMEGGDNLSAGAHIAAYEASKWVVMPDGPCFRLIGNTTLQNSMVAGTSRLC